MQRNIVRNLFCVLPPHTTEVEDSLTPEITEIPLYSTSASRARFSSNDPIAIRINIPQVPLRSLVRFKFCLSVDSDFSQYCCNFVCLFSFSSSLSFAHLFSKLNY